MLFKIKIIEISDDLKSIMILILKSKSCPSLFVGTILPVFVAYYYIHMQTSYFHTI